MKPMLMAIVMVVSSSAYAGPMRSRDFPGHRSERSDKIVRVENNHYHSSGPDWLGPALVLGTAAVIISQSQKPPAREVVVIREEPRVSYFKDKTLWEKIEGNRYSSLAMAKKSWKESCSQWRDELLDQYDQVEVSCGTMICEGKGSRKTCSSSGFANVKYY